ncbi:MAG: hypothetical protein AAF709_23775 [Pseudomonadota bacterium]
MIAAIDNVLFTMMVPGIGEETANGQLAIVLTDRFFGLGTFLSCTSKAH